LKGRRPTACTASSASMPPMAVKCVCRKRRCGEPSSRALPRNRRPSCHRHQEARDAQTTGDFGLTLVREGLSADYGWKYPRPRGAEYTKAEALTRGRCGAAAGRLERLLLDFPVGLGRPAETRRTQRGGPTFTTGAARPHAGDLG